MNYRFQVDGGGLFSRLLQCAIIPLADYQFDRVYLSAYPLPDPHSVDHHVKVGIQTVHDTVTLLRENGIADPWDNIFNFVLDQEADETFINGGLLSVGRFYDYKFPIENSHNFLKYKKKSSQLKIRDSIIRQSNNWTVDWSKVLGVHVRLKDSNSVDDPKTFFDYVNAINQNLKKYNYTKIFVAADNSLSIKKLEQIYPGMIFCNHLHRSDNEQADSFVWEYQNYFRRHYWVDAMIDCLTLSKCDTLICKNSNFGNAAIVYGNFRHIHRLSN